MNLSLEEIEAEADATGFLEEALDKVIRLIDLLNAFFQDSFLQGRIALKGGTALNLFVFDLPRLSIDIDLNYIASADLEVMLSERDRIEQAITSICDDKGFVIRRMPRAHAGGKWRLGYTNTLGRNANLEVDLVFTLRTPLWKLHLKDSHAVGGYVAKDIPLLDIHELAAGKLVALFARQVSRDLFDARTLFEHGNLDREKLRLGFVAYGACSRRDWRTISLDDVWCDRREFLLQLAPLLSRDIVPVEDEVSAWVERLVDECRGHVGDMLPFTDQEQEFLTRVNEQGEIVPELLTSDEDMATRIAQIPQLLWKAQNVQEYRKQH